VFPSLLISLFVSLVAWSLHIVRIRDPANKVVRAVADSPAGRTGKRQPRNKTWKKTNTSFVWTLGSTVSLRKGGKKEEGKKKIGLWGGTSPG